MFEKEPSHFEQYGQEHPIATYSHELASSYSEYRDTYSETDQKLFETIEDAGGVKKKTVLDLGCGDGKHARKMGEMGATFVLGVDLSPDMVKLAQEKTGTQKNIRFIVADGVRLPLKDASQEVIVSNFVIHYFKDSDAVFKEASRVLMPGGVLVATFNVTEVAPGSEALFNTPMPIRLGGKDSPVVVQNLIKSRQEILGSIEENRFAVLREEEIEHPMSTVDEAFPSKEKVHKRSMLYLLKKIA